jgi:hypothetical protein
VLVFCSRRDTAMNVPEMDYGYGGDNKLIIKVK